MAGKDVLMEYGGQGLYEPLDLQIAQCKLMTAGAIGVGVQVEKKCASINNNGPQAGRYR